MAIVQHLSRAKVAITKCFRTGKNTPKIKKKKKKKKTPLMVGSPSVYHMKFNIVVIVVIYHSYCFYYHSYHHSCCCWWLNCSCCFACCWLLVVPHLAQKVSPTSSKSARRSKVAASCVLALGSEKDFLGRRLAKGCHGEKPRCYPCEFPKSLQSFFFWVYNVFCCLQRKLFAKNMT